MFVAAKAVWARGLRLLFSESVDRCVECRWELQRRIMARRKWRRRWVRMRAPSRIGGRVVAPTWLVCNVLSGCSSGALLAEEDRPDRRMVLKRAMDVRNTYGRRLDCSRLE